MSIDFNGASTQVWGVWTGLTMATAPEDDSMQDHTSQTALYTQENAGNLTSFRLLPQLGEEPSLVQDYVNDRILPVPGEKLFSMQDSPVFAQKTARLRRSSHQIHHIVISRYLANKEKNGQGLFEKHMPERMCRGYAKTTPSEKISVCPKSRSPLIDELNMHTSTSPAESDNDQ